MYIYQGPVWLSQMPCLVETAEFLNVTVTWLCDRAKFCWVCAKSWDMYTQTRKLMHFYYLYMFLQLLCDFLSISCAFSCTICFKLSFDHAKNEILECLPSYYNTFYQSCPFTIYPSDTIRHTCVSTLLKRAYDSTRLIQQDFRFYQKVLKKHCFFNEN